MSYDSSSFSRSSPRSSSPSSSIAEGGELKRRRVRKKRRKTMTADDMRRGVTFQSGLTGKARLALAGVVLAGIALTVVVMMAVNGSFSLKALQADDNPENHNFRGNEGFELDAFAPDGETETPAAVAPAPMPDDAADAEGSETAPVKLPDDFFQNSPFEE